MSANNQTVFAYAIQAALGYALDATGVGVDSERGQRYVELADERLQLAQIKMADSAAEHEILEHLRKLVQALRTPDGSTV